MTLMIFRDTGGGLGRLAGILPPYRYNFRVLFFHRPGRQTCVQEDVMNRVSLSKNQVRTYWIAILCAILLAGCAGAKLPTMMK